jgi:hypothetical protein
MTSLSDYGIGLNCNPPKGEPGTKYELLKECGHVEAVELAILYRQHHPTTPIEIWPMDGDKRMVVIVK